MLQILRRCNNLSQFTPSRRGFQWLAFRTPDMQQALNMATRTQRPALHPQVIFLLVLMLIAVLAGLMSTVVPWV